MWAVGDCAWVPDRDPKKPCPPTAQHAIREARCLAENISASMRGESKKPFRFKALGKMGALGHHSAVAEVFGIKLSGFLAWFMWRAIYLMKLPGLDRKVRVATSWFLDLILPADIVQIKTERTPGIGRVHLGPGEFVFREGDKGDMLYVIMEGEVEVLKEEPGKEPVTLACLSDGDCFGEMALISDNPRMAAVRSKTKVNLLTVDSEAFQALFAHLPPLRGLFQQLIKERMGGSPPK